MHSDDDEAERRRRENSAQLMAAMRAQAANRSPAVRAVERRDRAAREARAARRLQESWSRPYVYRGPKKLPWPKGRRLVSQEPLNAGGGGHNYVSKQAARTRATHAARWQPQREPTDG